MSSDVGREDFRGVNPDCRSPGWFIKYGEHMEKGCCSDTDTVWSSLVGVLGGSGTDDRNDQEGDTLTSCSNEEDLSTTETFDEQCTRQGE